MKFAGTPKQNSCEKKKKNFKEKSRKLQVTADKTLIVKLNFSGTRANKFALDRNKIMKIENMEMLKTKKNKFHKFLSKSKKNIIVILK
jgi:hypothetical protein